MLNSVFRTSSCVALCVATPLMAEDQFLDTVLIRDALLCVGVECAPAEPDIPDRQGIKIKDLAPALLFEDVFQSENSPDRDWMLGAGDFNASIKDAFFLRDIDEGTDPVRIVGGAPNDALFVDATGRIGLGTSMPQESLHIVGGAGTGIRIEGTRNTPGNAIFEASVGNFGFFLADLDAVTFPFGVANAAPSNAMIIAETGNVGLGTFTPSAPLELSSDAAFNFFRITATGAAVNDSVDITFTGGPLGTGQLRYNIVDDDGQEMSLDADGNMVIAGTLTTAGATCAAGCDRVFDADYALPSIQDHAAEMLAKGHLPAIGPTVPHAPINLSERQGNIVNSLEHAHLYIHELHTGLDQALSRIDDQQAEIDALRQDLAKVTASD